MNAPMRQGDIYWIVFSPSVGHEYYGRRPAVIIEANSALRRTALITVMPLSSQITKRHKDDVVVHANKTNRLYRDSLVKVHHIVSLDKSRFVKKIGTLDAAAIQMVQRYIRVHFEM